MFPELEATIERFTNEMSTIDEMIHVLLKGHLLLEEALLLIIEQHVFHRESLVDAKLTFGQKTQIARAICLRKNDLGEWTLISAINGLRNDLAHRLNSPEREKKLARVKAIYFQEAAGFERIDEIRGMPDHEIIFNACAHCAGFLATCAADLRELRKLVYTMDRTMNPDFPAFEL